MKHDHPGRPALPYKTTTMRVPMDCKTAILAIVAAFKARVIK